MGMKPRNEPPSPKTGEELEAMTMEEQRDFYRGVAAEMTALAIWTLEKFGAQALLVFNEDKEDPNYGQVQRWQERFFDRLDKAGYVIDRVKYYDSVREERKRRG